MAPRTRTGTRIRPTKWTYKGAGTVLVNGESVAKVDCELQEREYLHQITQMGSREPVVGVARTEIWGRIRVEDANKEVLVGLRAPLELVLLDKENKPRVMVSHQAAAKVSRTGVYDVKQFN